MVACLRLFTGRPHHPPGYTRIYNKLRCVSHFGAGSHLPPAPDRTSTTLLSAVGIAGSPTFVTQSDAAEMAWFAECWTCSPAFLGVLIASGTAHRPASFIPGQVTRQDDQGNNQGYQESESESELFQHD